MHVTTEGMEGSDWMTRKCPIYGSTVLYLDCLECEEKLCRGGNDGKGRRFGSNSQDNRFATRQEDVKEDAVDETSEVW